MNVPLQQSIDDFIRSHQGLGESALKDLNNQSRGGGNNRKGNQHECHFAVFKLAEEFPEALQSEVRIKSQEKSFVDDLVITRDGGIAKSSYQLKNSPNVNWGGAKGIGNYFARQRILDTKYFGTPNAETVLVLADEETFKRLQGKIPESISAHTKVVHFENSSSPNRLLLSNKDFRRAIKNLSIHSEVDKLEVIVQGLVGAWTTHNGTIDNLAHIVQKAIEQTKPNYFKDFTGTEIALDPELAKVLDSIDNVHYEVCNGSLTYTVRDFNGTVSPRVGTSEFEQLSARVVAKQPQTAIDLVRILMGAEE